MGDIRLDLSDETNTIPPARDPMAERLVDLVESAYYYLRRHAAAPGSPEDAQRRALLAHMEATLSETLGYPQRPPERAWTPLEAEVAALVERLDGGAGAAYEEIVIAAALEGVPERDVELALDALLDGGALCEPTLGRLKRA